MKLSIKVAVIAVLVFFPFCSTSQALGQLFIPKSMLVGEPASDFKLRTYMGDLVSLSGTRQDNKAILFFWATWCPHCRTALDELQELEETIKGKGIKLYLIAMGEDAKIIGRYAKRNNLSMDVLLDEDAGVAGQYDVIGVPTFVFIDTNGLIADIRHDLPLSLDDVFVSAK